MVRNAFLGSLRGIKDGGGYLLKFKSSMAPKEEQYEETNLLIVSLRPRNFPVTVRACAREPMGGVRLRTSELRAFDRRVRACVFVRQGSLNQLGQRVSMPTKPKTSRAIFASPPALRFLPPQFAIIDRTE